MPLTVSLNGEVERLEPRQRWQTLKIREPIDSFRVHTGAFYVKVKQAGAQASDP